MIITITSLNIYITKFVFFSHLNIATKKLLHTIRKPFVLFHVVVIYFNVFIIAYIISKDDLSAHDRSLLDLSRSSHNILQPDIIFN